MWYEKFASFILTFAVYDFTLYTTFEGMLKPENWLIQFINGFFVPVSALAFAFCFWYSVKELTDVFHRKFFKEI